MKFSLTITSDDPQELTRVLGYCGQIPNVTPVSAPPTSISTTSLAVPPAPTPTPVPVAVDTPPPAMGAPYLPAALQAAAAPAPVSSSGTKLDEWGVAYDDTVHNSNEKFYQSGVDSGKWMRRRNVDEAAYSARYAGHARLGAPMTKAVPPPVASSPAAAPIPAPSPAAPTAPAAMRDVSEIVTFPQLARYINELQGRPDAAAFNARIAAALAELGYPKGLAQVGAASITNANVVPTVAMTLAALEVS